MRAPRSRSRRRLPTPVGLCVAHGLDPASPPRGRLPGFGDVDGLVNDLAVVELHDPDNVPWSAVVSDCVLVDPEVARADCPSYVEVEACRVSNSERENVGLSPDALSALREIENRIVSVDFRRCHLVPAGGLKVVSN